MRQEVTSEELADFLNEELRMRGLDFRVHGPIFQLQEPDEDGCNWSYALIVRHGDQEIDYGTLTELVRQARRRFNLREGCCGPFTCPPLRSPSCLPIS
jgi:hypothetical protein